VFKNQTLLIENEQTWDGKIDIWLKNRHVIENEHNILGKNGGKNRRMVENIYMLLKACGLFILKHFLKIKSQ
jgi:hypothetical protein